MIARLATTRLACGRSYIPGSPTSYLHTFQLVQANFKIAHVRQHFGAPQHAHAILSRSVCAARCREWRITVGTFGSVPPRRQSIHALRPVASALSERDESCVVKLVSRDHGKGLRRGSGCCGTPPLNGGRSHMQQSPAIAVRQIAGIEQRSIV